jgi:hypothetical protein
VLVAALGVLATLAALGAAIMPVCTAHAGLDNELSLVDGQDRTLTIQQRRGGGPRATSLVGLAHR